ncbi:uncharacterized protein LOC106469987 [Limulus polyphemus]|uniref:Uncharacterized protein LOC106469987 n=1 Tax=Limulus polyphemus TaxID=6850 RepID=A0ABM1TEF0_LIMPO|nr:uncharacterized protein LOC106469987 [Limulus polyphemus]
MTLVLSSTIFSHSSISKFRLLTDTPRIYTMPCGFDCDPLDFEESMLSEKWKTQNQVVSNNYVNKAISGPGEDSCSTPGDSASGENKRRLFKQEEEGTSQNKRHKHETENHELNGLPQQEINKFYSEDVRHQDDKDVTVEDLLYVPRRRVPLLWNPRLRLKDERRKVLKMSVNKLRRMKDPEELLQRSVLINNTIKCLQQDIREVCHSTEPPNTLLADSDIKNVSEKTVEFDVEPTGRSRSDSVSFSSSISSDEERCCNIFDQVFTTSEENSASHMHNTAVTNKIPVKTREVDSHPSPNLSDLGSQKYSVSVEQSDRLFIRGVSVLDSVVYHSLLASLES